MRILMLQSPARHQITRFDQSLDHRLVGVALLALVIDNPPARKARGLLGIGAVIIDREGNGSVDAALGQLAAIGHPDLEILAAMARSGMDKARARIIGDMVAIQHRHGEVVAH